MNEYVRVEKLQQVSETVTLSEGYWLMGQLAAEIKVGKPVLVARHVRNGVKIFGIFNTSPIKKIVPEGEGVLHLHTHNSVYKVEFIDREVITEILRERSTEN